jgi:hypothetical protein
MACSTTIIAILLLLFVMAIADQGTDAAGPMVVIASNSIPADDGMFSPEVKGSSALSKYKD